MDLLAQVAAGFATIDVDQAAKAKALGHLDQWLTKPEFTAYRPQLAWLIAEQRWAGLLDRFYQILPFGTGGRRGAVGIGPNRMNPWTLTASVQGHCEYLKERFPGIKPLFVVLAYDVRRFEDVRQQYNPKLPNPVLHLSSRDLARYAAGVYAANGIHSYILPPDSTRYLSTPELSFTIRLQRAHGGLNMSASHNPPDDNGGKFYDERGGQPVPPEDQIMADLVDQVAAIRSMPWADAVRNGLVTFLDETAHRAYIELSARQSLLGPAKPNELTVVFTPLHGVGSTTVMELLEKQRFRVVPVEEQMEPNGLFLHATSPNPEVPASMDRAAALASASPSAELILATDPDADRLGAMTKTRDGAWRYLNGNEIAALVAHFKLDQLAQQGRMPASPIIIKTEVTTELVTRIARKFGCQIVDDLLVGFKYVADVLWQLEKEGRHGDVQGTPSDFVIACEESHGILTTPQIRDKDAAGAALLLAELALYQKRRGLTVLDYLDQLFREFGYFQNQVQPVVMTGILGKKQMLDMLNSLRADPPEAIAGLRVTSFEDLQSEQSRFGEFKGDTDRAARNVLAFRLGEHARVVLRPSGTEPKAKAYIEASSDPCPPHLAAAQWREQCRKVDDLARQLARDFLRLALGRVGLTLPET
jgi:phosphoglucomutase/phosphomannomutase